VPGRRPSARALARLILGAVPGADLAPTPTTSATPVLEAQRPPRGRTASKTPAGAGPPASQPPTSSGTSEPQFAIPLLGPISAPGSPAPSRRGPEGPPFERRGSNGEGDLNAAIGAGAAADGIGGWFGKGAEALAGLSDPADGLDRDVDVVFGDQSTAEVDEVFVDRQWQDTGETDRVRAPRPIGRPGPEGRTNDNLGHAPRPAVRHGTNADRRRGRTLVSTALLLGCAVAVTGGYLLRTGSSPDAGARQPAAAAPSSPATDELCAATPSAPTDPTAATARDDAATDRSDQADVDGDGCLDAVVVTDRVVEAAGQRWALGEPGDTVAVGDWDCDGLATPAVYRPSSGEVFVFSRWATPEEALAVRPAALVGPEAGRSSGPAPRGLTARATG
jgi:hypothetical protein